LRNANQSRRLGWKFNALIRSTGQRRCVIWPYIKGQRGLFRGGFSRRTWICTYRRFFTRTAKVANGASVSAACAIWFFQARIRL
jgi:hypothetical protein